MLCFKIGSVCPEVKCNVVDERCREMFTIAGFLGGPAGRKQGFKAVRSSVLQNLFCSSARRPVEMLKPSYRVWDLHRSRQQLGLPVTRASQVQVFSMNQVKQKLENAFPIYW